MRDGRNLVMESDMDFVWTVDLYIVIRCILNQLWVVACAQVYIVENSYDHMRSWNLVFQKQQNNYKLIMSVKTLKVLVATIMYVGSARYEPALLPPCPTIRGLSYNS